MPKKNSSDVTTSGPVVSIPLYEVEFIERKLRDHRSVHDMFYAVAMMCDGGDVEGTDVARDICPGLAVVMNRLGVEQDEVREMLRYRAKNRTGVETGGTDR